MKLESRKKNQEKRREEKRREEENKESKEKQASNQGSKDGTMPLTTYLPILNLYFSYENIYLSLLKTRF